MDDDQMGYMRLAGRSLAAAIARCPIMLSAVTDRSYSTPCRRVIDSQMSLGLSDHELPEPWSGHIETAPILFISSNPSRGERDDPGFPHASWPDEEIYSYFDERFEQHIVEGIHLPGDNTYWVRFWASVKERARDLLERPPRYGVDYALTEVVHCKSREEEGISEALETCASMWLTPILSLSGAVVLVVLGDRARAATCKVLSIPADVSTLFGPVNVYGKRRIIAFLPHPNARGKRTFDGYPPDEIALLREYLTTPLNDPSLDPFPKGIDERYLTMLTEETTRKYVKRLALLKASYLRKEHEHHDPNVARALRDGAREIDKAALSRPVIVERFIHAYTPWLYNQEGWERTQNGNGPSSQYQKELTAAVEDFDSRHGYHFFD